MSIFTVRSDGSHAVFRGVCRRLGRPLGHARAGPQAPVQLGHDGAAIHLSVFVLPYLVAQVLGRSSPPFNAGESGPASIARSERAVGPHAPMPPQLGKTHLK